MNNHISSGKLIERYNLLSHPEGGYYKENYRSSEIIAQSCLPERFQGERSYSTAIYFLLEKGNFSAFHKIKSDECWHFYAGETLWIHIIQLDGKLETIRLGNDLMNGDQFQAIVPAGCWFASEPAPRTIYSFVGCTVAPGFDFSDFELAESNALAKQFPQHSALISRLCR